MKRGAYQLLVELRKDQIIAVGRLGTFLFPAGYYVYTGSALSGIENRVGRHLRRRKRAHWHIDYLLERACIIGYAIKESLVREECELNRQTLAIPGAEVPAVGFGCSDCGCKSHLVYFAIRPSLQLPIHFLAEYES